MMNAINKKRFIKLRLLAFFINFLPLFV